MKKFVLPLIFILTVGLIFSFVLVKAQENENKEEGKSVEIKEEKTFEFEYKPEKGERKLPVFSEEQLGPFKSLDDFVRKEIAEYPKASFFLLNPTGHAVQQGVVEQNQNNVLTVNSQGLKFDWTVATDTQVIIFPRLSFSTQTAPTVADIATGTRVKVFGSWDGQKLVAERIIVFAFEKRVSFEVEKLIEKLRELLQKAGINIDLTPLLQQLRK